MKGFRNIIVKTLLITPSGALSPGPLSLGAIVAGGYLGWVGGFYVALGHMAFELPYVAVLWRLSSKVEPLIKRHFKGLSTVLSVIILYFAFLSFQTAINPSNSHVQLPLNPSTPLGSFALGVLLTGLNPHFLLWWISAGFPLLTGSTSGAKALGIMYASHVWMDYAWLAVLAGAGGLASGFQPAYQLLMALVGLMLALFAADMLLRAWTGKRVIPF